MSYSVIIIIKGKCTEAAGEAQKCAVCSQLSPDQQVWSSGFPQASPAGDALICGFVSKYLMGTVHEQWTGSMQPVYFVNGFYILSRRHCYISP